MMNNYGYIYRVTNLLNAKVYTGQHKGNKFNPKYLGSGDHINRAVNKHGQEKFKVELICWASNQVELDRLEIFHIAESIRVFGRGNVYNIAPGGHGGGGIESHQLDCMCSVCRCRRGDAHKPDCQCFICKSRRGELRGKNSHMFGRTGEKSPVFGKCWKDSPETIKKKSKSLLGNKNASGGKGKSDPPETILRKRAAQQKLNTSPEMTLRRKEGQRKRREREKQLNQADG